MSSSGGCPSIDSATWPEAERSPFISRQCHYSSATKEENVMMDTSSCVIPSKMNEEAMTTKSSWYGSSIDYSTDGDASPMRSTPKSRFVEGNRQLVSYKRLCLQSTPTSQEANRVIDEAFDFCALGDSLPLSDSMMQMMIGGVEEEDEPLPIGHRWQMSVNTYRSHQQQRQLSGRRSSDSVRNAFAPIASSSPRTLSRQQRSLANWHRTTSTALELRLLEFQQAVNVLEHQKKQSSAALDLCRKKYAHRNSQQELDALRALLLTSERHSALKQEMKRFKQEIRGERQPTQVDQWPRGTLAIKQISILLNSRVGSEDKDDSYYLIALVKYRDIVLTTSTAHYIQPAVLDSVKFFDHIELNNLPPDFSITVEVHALCTTTSGGSPVRSPSCKSKGDSIRNKVVTLFSPHKLRRSPSATKAAAAAAAMKFERVGYLRLTREMVAAGSSSFYLDDVRYPLDGVIHFNMRCYATEDVANIEHHGFLTMYEDFSGHQSWSRYWCAITNGLLKFWKYPNDEETEKDPIEAIDLSQCASDQMKLISKEECPRPHTLVIDVIHQPAKSQVMPKRFLLAADSKDDCLEWMRVINEALRNLRFWKSNGTQV